MYTDTIALLNPAAHCLNNRLCIKLTCSIMFLCLLQTPEFFDSWNQSPLATLAAMVGGTTTWLSLHSANMFRPVTRLGMQQFLKQFQSWLGTHAVSKCCIHHHGSGWHGMSDFSMASGHS
jgi:hypothetical protein